MPQPQQTKGGGKGDGENPKGPAAESEQQPQDLSTADHVTRYIQQDLEDGVDDDHVSSIKQYGDEEAPDDDRRDTGVSHDFVQAQGPESSQVTDDHDNATPSYDQQIFDAVEKGAAGKLDKLLSRGEVSPDCRDSQGRTPLIVAAEAGNPAMVGVLIRHNANVNAVDADGETGLMKGAFGGHLSVAELLAENGADLGIRNNDGSAALEIAQIMKRDAVVAFLSAQSLGSTSQPEKMTLRDADFDEPTIYAPPGAAAAAALAQSPASRAYIEERGLEAISEVAKSSDFEPQKEPETTGEYREEEPVGTTPDSDSHSKAGEQADEVRTRISGRHHDVMGKKTGSRLAVPEHILAANEERIVFDAWDNRQIRSINEKAKETVEKASLELGDHTVDTVFKGSYMAVLKPRSQEYKRFRKLWKHPDLLFDPRRWRDFTGASAVRKYCLAEGIDVSTLRATHFVELYYVKDLKLILSLAEDASAYNYTVRQLKRAIEELREGKDEQDPGKVIIKTLDQPVPLLDDPDLAELCKDEDRVLEELSKAERKKIRSLIKARKPGLEEWKSLMDTLEGILTKLEDE